ncbi:MAG TPA: PH domain-containing protein [Euzebyales bacterium]|nr:PH domain-containing protein [Euzebyales bacterium]
MSDDAPATGPTTTDDAAGSPEAPGLGGRLHPSVIAVWLLRSLGALAVVVIASNTIERTFGLIVLVLVGVGAWVRWLRFTWRIEPGQLVIERGLFQRRRRVIPVARIQAVQTVRKIQHRAFGVVGLRVEAIGGSETEGQLDALDVELARRVQHALLQRADHPTTAMATPSGVDGSPAHAAVADTPPGTVLAHCSPRHLLLAGLTGGRVGVAAAIIGVAQQAFGEQLTEAALSAPERLGLIAALGLAVLGIVVAFVLSVLATAVVYWDFTVRRDRELLRVHRGVLDERRDTVPIARVQSLTVEQNVLRRALGLAAVKMVIAGRAGDDADMTSTLLPIGSRDEALRLVGELLDIADVDAVTLTPMPRGARDRRLVRAALATVVVTGATLVPVGWPLGLVGLSTAALVVPAALASYRALGWATHGDAVVARSGWLVQRLSVTPAAALQSVRLTSSPFQRRRQLATLRLEIARSRGARDPRLLDLAANDGSTLLRRLATASVPGRMATADPDGRGGGGSQLRTGA